MKAKNHLHYCDGDQSRLLWKPWGAPNQWSCTGQIITGQIGGGASRRSNDNEARLVVNGYNSDLDPHRVSHCVWDCTKLCKYFLASYHLVCVMSLKLNKYRLVRNLLVPSKYNGDLSGQTYFLLISLWFSFKFKLKKEGNSNVLCTGII